MRDERGVRVADFGDRLDRSLDDLRPPGAAHKRAVVVRVYLTAWPEISTRRQFSWTSGQAAVSVGGDGFWAGYDRDTGEAIPFGGRLAQPGTGRARA